MPETTETSLTALVRQEWSTFRSLGRLIAMAVAALSILALGFLPALLVESSCSEGPVEVACPTDPVGPHGGPVTDVFYFAHRPLGTEGSITVRLTEMTGIITYPPPNHDEIVAGLVPWAKAGIIIKDGTRQGSSYAALMMTGSHGVRLQHDYLHDLAGRSGTVSAQSPRWLRLTRSGDTITGFESADGVQWSTVGSVRVAGLAETAQVGLFAASPGDLSLQHVGLGAGLPQSRFTQATAVFDSINLTGAPTEAWSNGAVGEMGHTDWEKLHKADGVVEANGTLTITGTGDIAPGGTEGGRETERTLIGLVIGLIIVIVVAARFAGAAGARVLAAKAIVVGAVTFAVGLVAAGVVVTVGARVLGSGTLTVSGLTQVRAVVGAAALLAVAAILALALGGLVRRAWLAIIVSLGLLVVPFVVAVVPLFPDEVARWLLRLTPAAGFAVQQTVVEYPQVVGHYAPLSGYFPLPWWAGFAVLCGYAAILLRFAMLRRRSAAPLGDWR
ncbi:hypothetical protein ACWKSP_18260 [Micromonosporaceae bacterium Da 78-11]